MYGTLTLSLIITAALAVSASAPARAAPTQEPTRKGFVTDVEQTTEQNQDYRRVLYTGSHLQLVVMALPPGEHIGLETHPVDQFFRVEEGHGVVLIDGRRTPVSAGSGVIVPAGSRHDFFSTGKTPLKLYTLYAPPNHRDGTVHHTREDAERDHEHFDGKTTE